MPDYNNYEQDKNNYAKATIWKAAISECALKDTPFIQRLSVLEGPYGGLYNTIGEYTIQYAAPYEARLESRLAHTLEKIGSIHEDALVYAIRNIDEPKKLLFVVKWLVNHGAVIDEGTMRKAIESGDLETVKFLLANGGIGIVEPDPVVSGEMEMVKILLEYRSAIRPEVVPYAALYGQIQIADLLLQHGAIIPKDAIRMVAKQQDTMCKYILETENDPYDNWVPGIYKNFAKKCHEGLYKNLNNYEAIKYLISKGAQLGDKPIEVRATESNIIDLLTKQGATISYPPSEPGKPDLAIAKVENSNIEAYAGVQSFESNCQTLGTNSAAHDEL